MFFTGKGDDGYTGIFDTSKRLSKASALIEALGTVDELNSLLGISRAKADELSLKTAYKDSSFHDILKSIQEDLFVIQAELAGAPKTISEERVRALEKAIQDIERALPPLEEFVIPGESLFSAYLDYARSVSRRLERRVRALKGKRLSHATLKYCNRLSSMLFALARLAAAREGVKEQHPHY